MRCPFPEFCPRIRANFAEIYKQIESDPSLESRTRLLSLTFDPQHDTPKVLRDYAFKVAHTHDAALFKRWEFGVPRKDELPKIANCFGVLYSIEAGLILYDIVVALIKPGTLSPLMTAD
jgi:protein SCO1/2